MARWGEISRGVAPSPLLQTPHSPRKDPDSGMSGYNKALLNTAPRTQPAMDGMLWWGLEVGGPSLEATVFSSQN